MNPRIHLALLPVLLATPLVAQSTEFTSPPGYLTTEGDTYQNVGTTNGYSFLLGRYADMRLQQFDAEVQAQGRSMIKAIGHRIDGNRSYSDSTGAGRSYKNVTLHVGECDFKNVGRTWSTNAIGTPALVFSSAVKWPALSGRPANAPAPWDKAYRFPFSSPYAYGASNALLLDFEFAGGALANGASWSGNTSHSYYLDGVYLRTSAGSSNSVDLFNGGTSRIYCADSGNTSTNAYSGMYGYVNMFGPIYATTNYRNTARLYFTGFNLAANSPYVMAISTQLMANQVPMPAPFSCYNLAIDLTPAVFLAGTTNSNGFPAGQSNVHLGDLKTLDQMFPVATNPLDIYTQGVFDDSNGQEIVLTAPIRARPDFGVAMNTTAPDRKILYHYNPTSATGFGPYDYFYYNGLVRYER